MKRVICILLVLILALSLLTACGSNSGDVENSGSGPINWKLAHTSNEDHAWNHVAIRFAELVEEKTDGQITITVYPNSQLGSEADVLTSIQNGTVDITISGESLATYAPKADLIAAPYAYEDEDHVKRVLASEVGGEIIDEIGGAGYKVLFHNLRTPRNLTANKEIHTPADARNLRLRMSNSPLQISCWTAAGLNTSVMALSEVFTAINQGVIDAQENPYDYIYTNSFHEVQDYAIETEHVFSYIFYIIGNKQFDNLSDELKEAVLEAAEEAQEYADELYWADKDTYRQLLIDEGMTIITDVDKDAFKEAMAPAIKDYLDPEVYALYEKIQELK